MSNPFVRARIFTDDFSVEELRDRNSQTYVAGCRVSGTLLRLGTATVDGVKYRWAYPEFSGPEDGVIWVLASVKVSGGKGKVVGPWEEGETWEELPSQIPLPHHARDYFFFRDDF